MKVVVFGAHGWIGSQFVKLLESANCQVVLPDKCLRADDDVGVDSFIEHSGADRVVSLIGRTYGPGFSTIDYLEQPGKLVENLRDNLFAPVNLALICKKHTIHFSYLGTGCIFNREDPTSYSYTEDDKPDFFGSGYSTVKGFTDRLMHTLADSVLNVRIRMPITGEMGPRNFITKITQYKKICSIPNSMSVLPTLLPIMVDLVKNGTVGTINLTNPGVISHNEILDMYRDIVDPAFKYENFTIEEQNKILFSKRSNNQLDTSRLESLYPDVLDIKTAVRGCIMSIM